MTTGATTGVTVLDATSASGAPGPVLTALDAAAVRRWADLGVELLTEHRDEIDALNVYPVPDADTGSNLLVTMQAATEHLAEHLSDDAATVLAELAGGAARGAVGNSGFILSQLLRGVAEASRHETVAAAELAAGLTAGAELARSAVVDPVDGTVLTVASAAAEAARREQGGTLADVVTTAATAAADALRDTTTQLAELAAHGVVDAGGRGLVVLLDALVSVVTGVAPDRPVESPPQRRHRDGRPVSRETGSAEFGYEVQYRVDVSDAGGTDALRGALATLGDSLALVPVASGCVKVHVHVNDVGAAIEAGLDAGRVHGIEVVSFATQALGSSSSQTAVVAVAPGAGLAHLFEVEGVHTVDAVDGTAPSSADVLAAIWAGGADQIVLLPNASEVTRAAEAAARQARLNGARVAVVPTRSPVQGLAAVAVHDSSRPFDDDVVAMAEAAAATRIAELSVADEQALTAVGVCQPGDVLGLIDGEVVEIGRGMLAVAFNLVDRLLGVGAELMTVVTGDGAPTRAGELIEAHIRGRAPLTDVAVYAGGQPDHPLIIGAE